MAIYAQPNASQMEDISEIFRFANDTSGGTMFLSYILVIWSIAFIGSILTGKKAYRGFIFGNFLCAILSIILALWGVLQIAYMYFFIIALGFGLIWVKLSESRG